MNRFSLPAALVAGAMVLGLGSASVSAEPGNGQTVMMQSVGFAESVFVRDQVRAECQIETKLPHFIQAYASKHMNLTLVSELPESGKARVLTVEVTEVAEAGNAWTGRHKSLTIKGELRENGEVIGTFKARRSTNGGFVGGYKGNCSFFGRCAKALGKDVARWLQNPTMNAMLSG
jgi:hypothetical protein